MPGRVAKNTAYLLSAFVGQKILAFVYWTIVARNVGVEGAGRYFIAVSFTTIFSVFADLGLSNVLVREIAKFPDRAGKFLANVLGIKVFLSALTVAAALATSRILGYAPETQLMIAIASAVMVLDSAHLVFYGVMRGLQNLRYEAVGMIGGQVIIISAGLFFLSLRLPLPFLVVALLCGSLWNVLWAAVMLKRRYGIGFSLEYDRPIIVFFRQVAVPFALAGIFSRLYSYIDSIMLSKLVSEKAVGFYGIGYKIAFAFQFLPMAFSAALYPAMSEYYVQSREKLAAIFSVSMRYLLTLAVPISLGIAVLARQIVITVYGEPFIGAVLPLQILMFSLIFAFLYWPAGSILNACDRQRTNTAVMAVTMISNAALNALLIPRFEAAGAAVAALIGNAVLFLGALGAAREVAPIDRPAMFRSVYKIIASGAIMTLFLLFMRGSASLFLLIPTAAAVYAAAIFALRALTVQEVRQIVSIFLRKGKTVSDISAT